MKRRHVLDRMAALGAASLLAGCVNQRTAPGGANDDTTTGTTRTTTTGTTTTTETRTEETTESTTGETTSTTTTETPDEDGARDPPLAPGVVSRSIDFESDCASDTAGGGHEVSVDGDRVVVEGTFRTSDPCYVARIVDTDLEGDTYRIRVAAVRDTGAEDEPTACVQCLGRLTYTATISFEKPPANVEVTHRKDGSALG